MIESSNLRFAGDVAIENISVTTAKGMTQNITNQTVNIEIFEDLFSPFITGVITVKDSYDFVNLLPFIGEEYLDIKIYTPSIEEKDYIKQQFYIFKVSDRIITNDRTVVYQLHFISKEAIADVNKHVSKCYQGSISDIAKELISSPDYGLESKKTPVIEETQNKTKFISNFWTPVKSLNYISGIAQTKLGAATYMFFENRKGLNFVSLEYLYAQTPVIEYVYDNYSRDIQSDGRTIMNVNEDYKRILDLDVPVIQDYMERARSGMFASKIITADILTKKYYSKNFDIETDYEATHHLNAHAPFSKNNIRHPNSLVINYPKYYGVFNGYTDVSNAKSIQRRLSQFQQANSTKINITVLGRTDYTVGMKVLVTLNKVQPIAKQDEAADTLDTILSGYYIVSAINHSINKQKHQCVMELIKDSFVMDLNEGK
jgi:hypothetical protein